MVFLFLYLMSQELLVTLSVITAINHLQPKTEVMITSTSSARGHQGAWWYNACLNSNLNGFYYHQNHPPVPLFGLMWARWERINYSLKRTEIKITPVDF